MNKPGLPGETDLQAVNDCLPSLLPASNVCPRSQSCVFCRMEELHLLGTAKPVCGQRSWERESHLLVSELSVWFGFALDLLCVCLYTSVLTSLLSVPLP